jgi:hypothetical protein
LTALLSFQDEGGPSSKPTPATSAAPTVPIKDVKAPDQQKAERPTPEASKTPRITPEDEVAILQAAESVNSYMNFLP